MERDERFVLDHPSNERWWVIQDMKEMHAFASFYAGNPGSEALATAIHQMLVDGAVKEEYVHAHYENWGMVR